MAQTSRRSLLAGTAALAGAVPAFAVSTPSVDLPDPVDALFRRWLEVMDLEASQPHGSDEGLDEANATSAALEREIATAAPGTMKAGALCLFALRWGILPLYRQPCELNEGPEAEDATLAWNILPAILPSLSGTVREVADDFLAHPEREVRYSRLWSWPAAYQNAEAVR